METLSAILPLLGFKLQVWATAMRSSRNSIQKMSKLVITFRTCGVRNSLTEPVSSSMTSVYDVMQNMKAEKWRGGRINSSSICAGRDLIFGYNSRKDTTYRHPVHPMNAMRAVTPPPRTVWRMACGSSGEKKKEDSSRCHGRLAA